MSLYNAFRGLAKPASEVVNLAPKIMEADKHVLKELDRYLMQATKGAKGTSGAYKPTVDAINKYFTQPSFFTGNAIYGGRKMDAATAIGMGAGAFGAVRFGGISSRPFYDQLSTIAQKINPEGYSHLIQPKVIDSTMHLSKPGMALTSAPAALLDKGLFGGALNLAAHPYLSSMLTPMVVAGTVAGGVALTRRLAAARRLNLLRKGIAPKAYRDVALKLGLK